jgi:hypothetical protein
MKGAVINCAFIYFLNLTVIVKIPLEILHKIYEQETP